MPTPTPDPVLTFVVSLISSVGFPIAVATYLLVRLDKRMGELAEAFRELAQEMKIRRDSDR